jgi:iron only hydrogenase large subunit-like protein
MLGNLSTCKSPQGMLSALVKHYFAKKLGRSPLDVVIVSVMPCVAKKVNTPTLEYPSLDYVSFSVTSTG